MSAADVEYLKAQNAELDKKLAYISKQLYSIADSTYSTEAIKADTARTAMLVGGIVNAQTSGLSAVIAQAQVMGWPLLSTPKSVAPIPSCDYPTPAPRPLNSRLCCDKLTKTFGLRMPPWQSSVVRMLETIRPPGAAL